MICSHCNIKNPEGMKYCGHCGNPLALQCQVCEFQNPPGFKFCGNCGNSLILVSHSSVENKEKTSFLPVRTHPKGERRHLTVMFCDLVGSTALSNRLDPEDLRTIITEYQKTCEKIIDRYEGHIAQYLGDGILVYFGFPVAHENDAHRAVSSALGIIESIQAFNTQHVAEGNMPIAVRIGIHTGHVVIGDVGSFGQSQPLAMGATPNIAARLESLSAPNNCLISNITYKIVEGYFHCEAQGKHQVKGISEEIEVYKVVSENTAKVRFESQTIVQDKIPLLGRDKELKVLLDLWEEAKKGKSQNVLLSGDPGLGKSRIQYALMEQVVLEKNTWLMSHQCSPYHQQTAYYPFTSSIEQNALKFEGHETTKEKIKRLEEFLRTFGFNLKEVLPLFANIMSISIDETDYNATSFSIDQQRQKLIDLFITIFLERSKESNLLIIFEDLQWVDIHSLEVLTQLVHQFPSNKLLAIFSFRPEFKPPWRVQSHSISLTLTNLSRDATKEMIHHLTKGKELPKEILNQIILKTDGIPLFVEELTKMVLDSEILEEKEDHYALKGEVDSLEIPSTLHDSLIARLDRMSHTKIVAQIGAVIGRDFIYDLIQSASDMEEKVLQTSLDQLVEAEILIQKGVGSKTNYTFRHALIRDAAYQSLLKSQQKGIHLEIARAMTSKLPQLAPDHPEVVAYHFQQANMITEAVIYWTNAATKVRQHQANDEALEYLQKGLSILGQITDTSIRKELELNILIIQAPLLLMTEGFNSEPAFDASRRMKELAIDRSDDMNLFRALRGMIAYELFSGSIKKSIKYAEEALELAVKLQENHLLIEAKRQLAHACLFAGKLPQSLRLFDDSLALFNTNKSKTKGQLIGINPEILNLAQSSHLAWYLGFPDQAKKRIEQAAKMAERNNLPFEKALTSFIGGIVYYFLGDLENMKSAALKCEKISQEFGISQFIIEGNFLMGYVGASMGNLDKGLEIMSVAIENRIQEKALNGIQFHLLVYAETCLQSANFEKGHLAIDSAFEFNKQSGEQLLLSEIYRLKGELLFAKNPEPPFQEIMNYFKRSLQIAKNQKAKSLELRSTMSLANLLVQKGKPGEALSQLSNVYDWFTEGKETKDLILAKNMLENLKSIKPHQKANFDKSILN